MKTNRVGGQVEHRAFEVAPMKGQTLEGYAALFNTEARIGDFTETIAPGTFTRSLEDRSDVLALADHDTSKLLGRTKSGSLKLAEDTKGLHFALQIPDTQAGQDVRALAERGDLGGMSFGFIVRDGGDSWEGMKRTLRSVSLKEVSVISAWPAYEQTALDLALRHADFVKKLDTGVSWDIPDYRSRVLIMAELKGFI
jgi:HK97 family phage prohead protease